MLPIITQTVYQFDCNELGAVRYRPMLNGEYKAISAAIELDDADATINTIGQTVKVATEGVIDPDKHPSYLVELGFLQIFTKSITKDIQARYTCNAIVEVDEVVVSESENDNGEVVTTEHHETKRVKCGEVFPVLVPVGSAAVKYPENYDKLSKIVMGNVTINLKPLSVTDARNFTLAQKKQQSLAKDGKVNFDKRDLMSGHFNDDDVESMFTYLGIESIVNDGNVIKPTDFTQDEWCEWYQELPLNVVSQINDFFVDTPILYQKQVIECPKCGAKTTLEYKGLSDFLT